MRRFHYFLYDNYAQSQVKQTKDDPRFAFGENTDAVLTTIVDKQPGYCSYGELCGKSSTNIIDNFIHIGLLRRDGPAVLLDTPVFVHEDVAHLRCCFAKGVAHMAECLQTRKNDFYQLANCFGNGFPPEVNLYHILCGAILDGCFFEYISKRGLVSTSRLHRSGLDYLTIIYEQTPALDSFSKELLCSYNRFSDGLRSLQSFGDADGDRVDFFRFMCQKRLETLPATLTKIGALWDSLASDDKKKQLLDEA